MAVTAAHVLYAVQLDTILGAALLLDGISSYSLAAGIRESLLNGDGSFRPKWTAVQQQAPTVEFTTTRIANALAGIGVNGAIIDADLIGADGLKMFFQKVTEGGTRAGATSHEKLTVKEGLIYPATLNATNDSDANIVYRAAITYDGTNDPIVFAGSQSLEGTPTIDEGFVCGPVTINGTTINGIQSITVDFGVTVKALFGDGQVWPTLVYVAQVRPKITVRTLDVSALRATLTLDGVAQSVTDSAVYLRKMAEGGTRVADATAQHIKFSIDDGMILPRTVRGDDGSEFALDFDIIPTYDGANETLVISTASALP